MVSVFEKMKMSMAGKAGLLDDANSNSEEDITGLGARGRSAGPGIQIDADRGIELGRTPATKSMSMDRAADLTAEQHAAAFPADGLDEMRARAAKHHRALQVGLHFHRRGSRPPSPHLHRRCCRRLQVGLLNGRVVWRGPTKCDDMLWDMWFYNCQVHTPSFSEKAAVALKEPPSPHHLVLGSTTR
jgi:hypothetical protein